MPVILQITCSDDKDKYCTCGHIYHRSDYDATAMDENTAQYDMFEDNDEYLAVEIHVEILSFAFFDNTDRS